MKTTRTVLPLAVVFAIVACFASVGSAQNPVEVKIKKIEVIEQTSPVYAVDLVTEKRIRRNPATGTVPYVEFIGINTVEVESWSSLCRIYHIWLLENSIC